LHHDPCTTGAGRGGFSAAARRRLFYFPASIMTDIPEAALRARQMYLDGRSIADIRRESGLTVTQFYLWLKGGPERDGARPLPEIPRRRLQTASARKPVRRATLIARMMNAAERQVREIEEKLVVSDDELEGRERNARVLAVLVKTLSELSSADARMPRARARKPKADDDDDAIPRDIDELRRELSRRLDAMAAGHPPGIPGADGPKRH
jgi:hypothetical protein